MFRPLSAFVAHPESWILARRASRCEVRPARTRRSRVCRSDSLNPITSMLATGTTEPSSLKLDSHFSIRHTMDPGHQHAGQAR